MADPDKTKKKSKTVPAKPQENVVVPSSPDKSAPTATNQSKTTLFTWLRRYVDFKNLDSFIAEEKGSGSIKDSLLIIFVAQLVSLVTLFIATMLSSYIFPASAIPPDQILLGLIVIILVGGIVIFYLTAGLIFGISKLLGGKGELAAQARFMAIVTLCSNVISAPLAFISIFFTSGSLAAFVISFLVSLIGLYELYAFYKTIRATHSISMFRALVALAGTLLVLYIGAYLLVGMGS